MPIYLTGQCADIKMGVQNFVSAYPYAAEKLNANINVCVLHESENFSFKVDKGEKEIKIEYKRKCDFFRALGCIIAAEKSETAFSQRAVFNKCGVMLDVSRNAVYTVAQTKEFFVWLALCGLNTCYLYMEDTYKLEKYPYFGYLRGAYSKRELQELDAFADSLGIELVPCIQTLSHLATTLKWDYASSMKDTQSTLMIGTDKTYEFIREMLKSLKDTFFTKRIHIGMDEAMDLGTGTYLRKNGFKPQFNLMLEHLNKVANMADELGLIPIIWDDMFYRSKNEALDYYNPNVNLTQEDIDRVPKNVHLVYWDYYHNNRQEYDCMLDKRSEFIQHLIFAGGIWKWNGWVPNYGKTFTTTHAALKACANKNITEVFSALWGDNGAEAPLHTAWPGLVLYGQYAYGASTADEAVSQSCKAFTGLSLEGFKEIEELDLLPGCERPNIKTRNPSKYILYQDILLGAFDSYFQSGEAANHYEASAKRLKVLAHGAEYSQSIKSILLMYASLASVLADKSTLGQDIRNAYREDNKKQLSEICTRLDKLSLKVSDLHNKFVAVWCESSKGAGLEVHDIRLGGIIGRINTVKTRISMYLSNKLQTLDELEEDILPFKQQSGDDNGYPVCNKYHLIATQNLF